jgi:hypothetical protein
MHMSGSWPSNLNGGDRRDQRAGRYIGPRDPIKQNHVFGFVHEVRVSRVVQLSLRVERRAFRAEQLRRELNHEADSEGRACEQITEDRDELACSSIVLVRAAVRKEADVAAACIRINVGPTVKCHTFSMRRH